MPSPLPAYAELHCLSNFSFLKGASHPAELVERAARLGYTALALTDECSLGGIVRAHVAAPRDCIGRRRMNFGSGGRAASARAILRAGSCGLRVILRLAVIGQHFDLSEQAKQSNWLARYLNGSFFMRQGGLRNFPAGHS